jgi:hypothetical protein
MAALKSGSHVALASTVALASIGVGERAGW